MPNPKPARRGREAWIVRLARRYGFRIVEILVRLLIEALDQWTSSR